MSEENVELIRRMYGLWEAGESARELVAEDLEYVNPSYAVESGVKRGRSFLGAIREVYPDFTSTPEEFLDAGEDVVVIGVARGTGASGVRVEWRQGYIWTVREGRVVRFQWFNDPAEALAAAGLEA
jgi:ketosteroid isomerase-like protein